MENKFKIIPKCYYCKTSHFDEDDCPPPKEINIKQDEKQNNKLY